MGAGADRAEGDGLGPHPACCRENVEARADVESLVVNPLGAAAVYQGVAGQHVVHEDLPHKDDSARGGGGRRGGGWLLRRRVGIWIGSWRSTRGRLLLAPDKRLIAQLEELPGDGGQAEVGDLLDLREAVCGENLNTEGGAQDRASDCADRVGIAADVGGVQQRLRRGVACE